MDIRLNGDRDGVDAAPELSRKYGLRCLVHHRAYGPSSAARVLSLPVQLGGCPSLIPCPRSCKPVREALKTLDD